MDKAGFLFIVSRSLPVPGLGLLLLPAETASPLLPLPLHSALAVTLQLPDGQHHPAIATVEEISADALPQRALLLTDATWSNPLPAGTTVWARPDAAADAYAGLI